MCKKPTGRGGPGRGQGRKPTHPQQSQLIRMRITDEEKERVLVIPPRRRAEVLLAEYARITCQQNGIKQDEN